MKKKKGARTHTAQINKLDSPIESLGFGVTLFTIVLSPSLIHVDEIARTSGAMAV